MNDVKNTRGRSTLFIKILGTLMSLFFLKPIITLIIHSIKYPQYFIYNLLNQIKDPLFILFILASLLSLIFTNLIIKSNNEVRIKRIIYLIFFLILFILMCVSIYFIYFYTPLK